MATAAPSGPLRTGQHVRRRIDPVDTPLVGIVAGLVFADQNLALVRWPGGWSTYETEDTLIEAFRAATLAWCQFCHERVDPENDRFVVIPDAPQPDPRKVAHTECHQRHTESSR